MIGSGFAPSEGYLRLFWGVCFERVTPVFCRCYKRFPEPLTNAARPPVTRSVCKDSYVENVPNRTCRRYAQCLTLEQQHSCS